MDFSDLQQMMLRKKRNAFDSSQRHCYFGNMTFLKQTG